MAQLLDHRGQPVDTSALKKVIAEPSLMSVRSILSGHPADGLTPQRLASILRGAETGDIRSYLELAEQMEEKQTQYLSVLGTRKLAVTQLEITVEAAEDNPAGQEHADLIRNWLKRDELQDELLDLLDAIGKGRSHTEIIWDTSANQWMPRCLEFRDPKWFTTEIVDGRTPMIWADDGQRVPLPPYKFIVHDHKAKSGLPIRGGLARPVAWVYLFQNYTLKDWVAFAEIYGLPLRIGKYDNGETMENIRLLMQAVANVGSDAAAVIPRSMEIEFVDGGEGRGGSADIFSGLCAYLDRQISKLVLGQTATTDADTGGLGSGAEHGEVRDDIKLADGKRVGSSINQQLVRPIIDLNYGPQPLGYPRVSLGMAETVDVTAFSTAVSLLVPQGLKVKQAEVRAKMGLSDPEAGDEIMEPPATPPPPEPGADPTDPTAPPKKPPQAAGSPAPSGGAGQRAVAATGLLRALIAASGDPPAESTKSIFQGDAIDLAVAHDLDGWEAMMSPALDALDALAASCSSLDELRQRLPEALADFKPDALADLIARGSFAARLAGLSGGALSSGEPVT